VSKREKNIKTIIVVSNTHWDREFRRSFEKTRVGLVQMMDSLLDILEKDPSYHSYTLDGHALLLEDYLEMRPEREPQLREYLSSGRIIAGPWYTLAEEFSIQEECITRNLLYGKKTLEKYDAKTGTVAYTPSSWGQTGQLPQVLRGFGLDKMMFYRGISHHESDSEFIWEAPDGTWVYASRFAIYARYNWYYQVHRPVTRDGKVFEKDYAWGKHDEVAFRWSGGADEQDSSYELLNPSLSLDLSLVGEAVEKMVDAEGDHFTTPVFLAMHGHDISVPHPLETKIIAGAQESLGHKYEIRHGSLEDFWKEAIPFLDREKMVVLKGERRAYLKKGMWTYLFPGTISARTYLKQQDYRSYSALVRTAEPLAALAFSLGLEYPSRYVHRAWKYYLSNHTHDANGGCAPDEVCKDMEYRYRKTMDIASIISTESIKHIARDLAPTGQSEDIMQLVVVNPLPFARNVVVKLDVEMPSAAGGKSVLFTSDSDPTVERQPVYSEPSSVFVDSAWDVPTILPSKKHVLHAWFKNLPASGYRVYQVLASPDELRLQKGMVSGSNTLENEFLEVQVNGNGTINLRCKETGATYTGLNYLSDEGEAGNAWQHVSLRHDTRITSLGSSATISVEENGHLSSTISASLELEVPIDYSDGFQRNEQQVMLPVKVHYTLEKGARFVKTRIEIDNKAKDHWLRVNFPTGMNTTKSWADTHYDIVSRDIPLPDSSNWVEEAKGTHPLLNFVDLNDEKRGIAVITKGIYEYEVFDDKNRTLSLTLIRACRIKLKVSEEKVTELPDEGIQCPGKHEFEYAIYPHQGDCFAGEVQKVALEYQVPANVASTGRGKGSLPLEFSLFTLDNSRVKLAAIKHPEDADGLIARLYNPGLSTERVTIRFGKPLIQAWLCKHNEEKVLELVHQKDSLEILVEPKKIITIRIIFS
jgi:mannosylglycerate hydrolase